MAAVVIFDIGGVLVPEGNRIRELQDHLASLVGEFDRDEFVDAYWAIRDGYDLGATDRQFWVPVLRRAGIPISDETVARAAAKDAELNSTIAREPLQLLTELSAAGVPLGILSNAPRPMAQRVREREWASLFSHLVFSSDHGAMKPDQQIYNIVSAAFEGVDQPNFHFFDDRETNIVGAHVAGWQAHLWRNTAHARDWLTVNGIIPSTSLGE